MAAEADVEEELERQRMERLERARLRKERLAMFKKKPKLSNPQVINDLEKEPAYLRKGINLDDVPGSDEVNLSDWVISNDEENGPVLKEKNAHLHKKID